MTTPFDSFYLNIFPLDSSSVFEYTAVTYPHVGVKCFKNVHDCFKPPTTFSGKTSGKTGIKNLRIWTD